MQPSTLSEVRKVIVKTIIAVVVGFLAMYFTTFHNSKASQPVKEWTFLVFINGNNNLDRFGAININEMEKVGSTDRVNVVVQWASMKEKSVKRLLVKKDDSPNVTSPIVEEMGPVDMGNYNSLIDFVKWAAANYPARHYFIDVWDHGTGWHRKKVRRKGSNFQLDDISHDDKTGNHITTEQLGVAIQESARIIGHKIDLYGSDACLMMMPEIFAEMEDAVEIFAGSEENEPALGWPYDALLREWNALPNATPANVAKVLTSEYIKSYTNGSHGNDDVTFSAIDVTQTGPLITALANLASQLIALEESSKAKVRTLLRQVLSFDAPNDDYADIGHFVDVLIANNPGDFPVTALAAVKKELASTIVANEATGKYAKAQGLSIWLPRTQRDLDNYIQRYERMKFHQATGWGRLARELVPPPKN